MSPTEELVHRALRGKGEIAAPDEWGDVDMTPRERLPDTGQERPLRVLRLSRHARARAARRNVVSDAVDYVLAHGRMLQRTGATFYFLGKRDIPAADRGADWAVRLAGTVVLLGHDGEVVTVYRNQRALAAIRRKLKYRLTPEQCPAMRTLEERRRTA